MIFIVWYWCGYSNFSLKKNTVRSLRGKSGLVMAATHTGVSDLRGLREADMEAREACFHP